MRLKNPDQVAAFNASYFLHGFMRDYRTKRDTSTFLEDQRRRLIKFDAKVAAAAQAGQVPPPPAVTTVNMVHGMSPINPLLVPPPAPTLQVNVPPLVPNFPTVVPPLPSNVPTLVPPPGPTFAPAAPPVITATKTVNVPRYTEAPAVAGPGPSTLSMQAAARNPLHHPVVVRPPGIRTFREIEDSESGSNEEKVLVSRNEGKRMEGPKSKLEKNNKPPADGRKEKGKRKEDDVIKVKPRPANSMKTKKDLMMVVEMPNERKRATRTVVEETSGSETDGKPRSRILTKKHDSRKIKPMKKRKHITESEDSGSDSDVKSRPPANRNRRPIPKKPTKGNGTKKQPELDDEESSFDSGSESDVDDKRRPRLHASKKASRRDRKVRKRKLVSESDTFSASSVAPPKPAKSAAATPKTRPRAPVPSGEFFDPPCSRCAQTEKSCEKQEGGGACVPCRRFKHKCEYARAQTTKSKPIVESEDEVMTAAPRDTRKAAEVAKLAISDAVAGVETPRVNKRKPRGNGKFFFFSILLFPYHSSTVKPKVVQPTVHELLRQILDRLNDVRELVVPVTAFIEMMQDQEHPLSLVEAAEAVLQRAAEPSLLTGCVPPAGQPLPASEDVEMVPPPPSQVNVIGPTPENSQEGEQALTQLHPTPRQVVPSLPSSPPIRPGDIFTPPSSPTPSLTLPVSSSLDANNPTSSVIAQADAHPAAKSADILKGSDDSQVVVTPLDGTTPLDADNSHSLDSEGNILTFPPPPSSNLAPAVPSSSQSSAHQTRSRSKSPSAIPLALSVPEVSPPRTRSGPRSRSPTPTPMPGSKRKLTLEQEDGVESKKHRTS